MYSLDIDTKKAEFGFINIPKAAGMASRNTLNTMAALTRRRYLKNAQAELTLLSSFTKRNIRFDKTDYLKISRQKTEAGATERAQYMELQEDGGIKKTKGGNNIAMAQDAARGGSNKRRVLKANYLKKIQRRTVRWPTSGGSKRSRILRVAAAAKTKGLFMNYGQNIYKITSFSRMNGRATFSKQHIYNVSQKAARIKPVAMLGPATKKPIADAQGIFNSQIKKMLRQKNII